MQKREIVYVLAGIAGVAGLSVAILAWRYPVAPTAPAPLSTPSISVQATLPTTPPLPRYRETPAPTRHKAVPQPEEIASRRDRQMNVGQGRTGIAISTNQSGGATIGFVENSGDAK